MHAWLGAIGVLVVTITLVALDLAVGSVHRYGAQHTFTSSVLSGVLVLLLTVLIVDRVAYHRHNQNKGRAIAAQAAVIVAQAGRTVDAVGRIGKSDDQHEAAAEEMRTYMMMLLTSAPLLIDATHSRLFLETAQRVALQLGRVLRATADPAVRPPTSSISLDDEIAQLRGSAVPLLNALNQDERAAVNSASAGVEDS